MISSSLYNRNLKRDRKTVKWAVANGEVSLRGVTSNRLKAYSFSPSLTWVPPKSGKRTLSPSLTETGIRFPALSLAPGPTAMTLPEFNCVRSNPISYKGWDFFKERIKGDFFFTWADFSGRRMPETVFDGGRIFSTNTRLSVGIKRFAIFLLRDRITKLRSALSSSARFSLVKWMF